MLKKTGISAAIAACAALSFQIHVGAQGQRAAGPGRPTGGATTAAAGATRTAHAAIARRSQVRTALTIRS